MKDNTSNILAAISSTDLASLVVPMPQDIEKIMISGDWTAKLQLIAKQAKESLETQEVLLTGFASKMTEMAKVINRNYNPQIAAFQSISSKLQPIIFQHTKFAQEISNIDLQANTAIDVIKTMSSFNAFQRYHETFKEYGGDIDPNDITEEEIKQTIEENEELLKEINEVVLNAETDGYSPGDTPALIYTFLIKKVPNISKRTFGIIVLIFTTIIIYYGLYSNYTTNTTLDEKVVPALEQIKETENLQNQELFKIKEESKKNLEEIEETEKKVDAIDTKVNSIEDDFDELQDGYDELQNDIDEYQSETNNRLDSIIKEMRTSQNIKKEK